MFQEVSLLLLRFLMELACIEIKSGWQGTKLYCCGDFYVPIFRNSLLMTISFISIYSVLVNRPPQIINQVSIVT